MASLYTLGLRWQGRALQQRLEAATQEPEQAQAQLLRQLLSRHGDTQFGREHRFDQIRTPLDYRRAVPIRDYEGFRPYVERMVAGQAKILVNEPVRMFTMTSGTTGQPKYIPVTAGVERGGSRLMQQWLYRILQDHPRFLSRAVVGIVSPAIEGYTPGGIPYGSLSGRIYQQIPALIRRTYAIPYKVFEIADYDRRYWAIARYALARQVSFLSTPNPSTLKRLATVMTYQAESLIQAIHDGAGGEGIPTQRPQPERAKQLEQIFTTTGALRPQDCWPHLALLSCWTGGSVGAQAQQLTADFGPLPIRDLGYLASEARITLPYQNNTPTGLLDLTLNVYEFIPEDCADQANPPILLSHELEPGQRYQILLTTPGGLYRYHINDVVEVTGFYHRSPLVAFLRKGRDMSNLTGEKLHVNHVLAAIAHLQHQFHQPIGPYRLVANAEAMRYELHWETPDSPSQDWVHQLLSAFDTALAENNTEYAQKRASGRLNAPCLHRMKPGWAEVTQRRAIAQGQREVQYKWPVLTQQPLPLDTEAIAQTYELTLPYAHPH
ncbi:GH3 auxin-responsive promoter family protein [Nodosilinea sp. LEGE 06152]|uniref:GH3 auxin-responsive promoter family protein n=1 Tax=Nodosilinea sp. LEGE 06152 TaxID=2777966 RepID=UPI00188274AF|nr:GH3 auxin-responsive promoter family protein [Nodosilinea sp. LEGE 06152]MBE9159875.1 GH3 auxin-responsive promoter family protein [Nodosilinea sp. LEGE 06152]